MQPSPQLVWLRDYLQRTTGSSAPLPLEHVLLEHPAELPRLRGNPVDRPTNAVPPVWFDCLTTPTGQRLASKLGEHSGYTQEYLSWAPSVSYLFDLTVGFARLLAHPETDEGVRRALFPTVFTYAALLDQQVGLLDVHKVHAEYAGTASEHIYKALQVDQRARAKTHEYRAGSTVETLQKVEKELLTQQLKHTAKTAAGRSTGGSRSTGRSYPGQTTNGKPTAASSKPNPKPSSAP